MGEEAQGGTVEPAPSPLWADAFQEVCVQQREERRPDMALGTMDRRGATWNGIAPGLREQAVEVAVFLFLIVPSLVLSLFAVPQGSVSFPLVAVATIFRDLSLVGLVLFFLWRNGETVAHIGWTARRAWKEVLLGVVLFVPFFFGAALLELGLERVGLSVPKTSASFLEPQGTAEVALAVALVVVVALAEETIFRGYLLLRFEAVLGGPAAAVLLSSFIFSLGHGYEGSAGLVTVGVMGAVFAIVYLWRRSLVAPMVLHFLQDFVSIVLLPLLALK
jgi:membrane protease YdiL (CAAX protease family)